MKVIDEIQIRKDKILFLNTASPSYYIGDNLIIGGQKYTITPMHGFKNSISIICDNNINMVGMEIEGIERVNRRN